jgi:hypothetical protein
MEQPCSEFRTGNPPVNLFEGLCMSKQLFRTPAACNEQPSIITCSDLNEAHRNSGQSLSMFLPQTLSHSERRRSTSIESTGHIILLATLEGSTQILAPICRLRRYRSSPLHFGCLTPLPR